MHTYGFHGNTPIYGGNGNGGMPSASASGNGITSIRSTEGKVAKMFVEKTNLMVFNSALFADVVLALGGEPLQPRVMEIVKSLIYSLAMEYNAGVVNEATITAMRLYDTLAEYGQTN